MKLYMYRGLPGSGKTTHALDIIKNDSSVKRVNKDDLRAMMGSPFSYFNEKLVLKLRDAFIRCLLEEGKSVIVDDTNFAEKHERRLRELGRKYGAQFVVVDFDTPLEECIKRDARRDKPVGEKVIRDMYAKYLATTTSPTSPTFTLSSVLPPKYQDGLPYCIIVDVDGTVAEMHNRGPFEWDKVSQDNYRLPVIGVVHSLSENLKLKGQGNIIFVSGRSEVCRADTESWLRVYFRDFKLYMRPADNNERDSVVKRRIYEENIKDKYNVYAIFDDRPQVIRECWQALGFGDRIFNVGDGREF